MGTGNTRADIHIEKASDALGEAKRLFNGGFFDGARSRATVASIQVMKAAMALNSTPSDPTEVAECVKAWTKDGRLPAGCDRYFQAAMTVRAEADETHLRANEKSAENALQAADQFSLIVQMAAGIIHSNSRPTMSSAYTRKL